MNDKLKRSNNVNHNIDLLYEFNLSDKNSLTIFNTSTRDITNLNALKCIKSGVIVLEKCVIPDDYYENNVHQTYESKVSTKTVTGQIVSVALKDDSNTSKPLVNECRRGPINASPAPKGLSPLTL